MKAELTFPRLLGDIGGTNARFALQMHPGGDICHARSLSCAAFAGPADAIRQYLSDLDGAAGQRPVIGALGVATPVLGDEVSMTNHPWRFSISALRQNLGFERLQVINDFTALALALPDLKESERTQVGGTHPVEGSPLAVLGPGTGLGVSGLIPGSGRWTPIAGEGGHVTLPASNEREAALIAHIRRKTGHVSAERALSGQGLRNLYDAVCALNQRQALDLSPAEISSRALRRECADCIEALAHFCAFLGTVASNLALTLGARGGVYLGGGIVPGLGDYFPGSSFRERFVDKGRYRAWLESVPVYVITAPWPGLTGAARALDG